MSLPKDETLFQKDRRKNFREQWTDRRQFLRPTQRLTRLKIIMGAIFVIIGLVILFIINPKI